MPARNPTRRHRASLLWIAGFVALGATLAASLTGCTETPTSSPPDQPPPSTPAGGLLTFGVAEDSASWSPTSGRWDATHYQVGRTLFDPLVAYDETYTPKPFLAQDLRANDDFTQWTIELRDGIRFHDGTALDADAVRNDLEAAREAPALADSLRPILKVEVTNPHEVVVTTGTPWSVFPHVLASQVGFIAAPASLRDEHAPPVGTGPFAFENAELGDHLRVRRNEGYWQETKPQLDTIEFRTIADPAARLRLVRAGKLDIAEISEPEAEAAATQEQQSGVSPVQLLTDDSGETPELVIALQTAKLPFSSSPARQAVAFGVDREAVSKRIYSGAYTRADGPYSEGSPWYGQAPWPAWDAGKARKSAMDYQRDTGFPLRFRLMVPDEPLYGALGQLLMTELTAAGMDVSLEVVPIEEARERAARGDYDAALLTLFAGGHPDEDYGLLKGQLDPFLPGEPVQNIARFRDKIVDQALDTARSTADASKQGEAYQKVQEQLAREAPYVFLCHVQGTLVASPRVQGLTTWKLPDGSPGIAQMRSTVSLLQTWIAPPSR